MLSRLWAWLLGYYIIQVEGENIQRMLNLALQKGLNLYDIVWISDNHLEAKIPAVFFRYLHQLEVDGDCIVTVTSGRGLPHVAHYLLHKRLMLPAGLFLFLAAFYIVSGFALFIEVSPAEPLKNVTQEAILSEASRAGIKTGCRFTAIDIETAEKQIIKNIKDLSWVHIERQGTLLRIKVVEKLTMDEEEKTADYGAIYAPRNGVIEKILILYGIAEIAEGNTVSAGQLLVSPNAQGKASAIINTRVSYKAIGECALREEKKVNDGPLLEFLSCSLPNGKGRIFLNAPIYKVDTDKMVLRHKEKQRISLWRNIYLPVEIIQEYWQPLKVIEITRTSQEAQEKALANARNSLMLVLPAASQMLTEKVQVLSEEGNLCRLEVTWECLENFGAR